MQIRKAIPEDLPAIVQLLKTSMGEALLPKSAAYFLWKHEQNPFGASHILLADNDGELAGIRAFMRWQWNKNGETITAVRAVDTATHPDYRGKGIFKKLTLQVAASCEQDGIGMVFNSPNANSLPGYLKMGWLHAGSMPIQLGIGSLLPRLYAEQTVNHLYEVFNFGRAMQQLDADWLLPVLPTCWHTPLNYHFLDWRYGQCPVSSYGGIIEANQFGFVFRLKKIKGFIELRICEAWLHQASASTEAIVALQSLIKQVRPLLISCAVSPHFLNQDRKIIQYKLPLKIGPITTVKPLHCKNVAEFLHFKNWQPSIGSMELF